MHTCVRGSGNGAEPRSHRGRWAIALVGAVALTLGPGMMAASAAELTPQETPVVAATEAASADPAVASAAEIAAESQAAAEAQAALEAQALAEAQALVEAQALAEAQAAEAQAAAAAQAAAQAAAEAQAAATEQSASAAETPADPTSSEADASDAQAPVESPAPAPAPEASESAASPSARGEQPTSVVPSAQTKNGSENPHNQVTLCHAKGSGAEKKPYVQITVNANGSASGHIGHQGGRDIIPPFTYNDHGNEVTFPGQNWDADGQAVFANGCNPVEQPPDPDPEPPVLSIDPMSCVAVGAAVPESVEVQVGGLTAPGAWTLTVTSGDFSAAVAVSDNGTYSVPISGTGSYTVTIGDSEAVADTATFTIMRCPDPQQTDDPVLAVPELACVPVDSPLPETVTVTVTGFAEPTIESVSPLAADGGYTLEIAGGSGEASSVPVFANGTYELPLAGLGTYAIDLLHGDVVIGSGNVAVVRCDTPQPTTELGVMVSLSPCTVAGGVLPSAATVTVTGLAIGDAVSVNLAGPSEAPVTRNGTATGSTLTIAVPLSGVGAYTVTAIRGDTTVSDEIVVAACPVSPPTPPVPPVPPTPPVSPEVVQPPSPAPSIVPSVTVVAREARAVDVPMPMLAVTGSNEFGVVSIACAALALITVGGVMTLRTVGRLRTEQR